MTPLARIASALVAVTALTFSFTASAESKHEAGHHHAQESAYPMKADSFKKLVDNRVDRLKAHLEQGLGKRSLTPEQKADIEKAMDSAMKELQAAVDKVSSDGTVSRDEAKQIKSLSEQLRNRMRAELRGKHANAKLKDKTAKVAKAGGKHKGKAAAASKKSAKGGFVLKDKKEK